LAHIVGLVDAQVTSDDAHRSKPCPDIFQAALAKLNDIDPAHALVVGDSPYDAEAARHARLRMIGLRCGEFPESGLRAAGCNVIFDDPQDLLRNFERSPLADQ
jgi:beta-phosphoglucomutase-like phosphatase (HAD superfamily)